MKSQPLPKFDMSKKSDVQDSRLSNLLNNLPNVVLYEKGRGQDFISSNIEEMIGYSVVELLSEQDFIFNLIHPEDRGEILATIADFTGHDQKDILTSEYRLQVKSGEYKWIQDHIIKHIDKEQTTYTGVLVDITERKISEQKLEASENRFRYLIEHLPECVLVIRDEKADYANRSALRLLHQTEENIPNIVLEDYIIDPYRDKFYKLVEDITKGSHEGFVELKLIVPSNGNLLDVEMTGTLQEDGSTQLVFHDISTRKLLAREQLRAQMAEESNVQLQKEVQERKKAEQELLKNQKYTNSIIQSSLDMIVATDNEDNINEFNPAAEHTFGYKRDEVIGKNVNMLFSDAEEMDEVLLTIKKKGSFGSEIVNRKKDNSLFITFLSASVLKDEEGNVVGSMGVSRDITSLKKAEEELKLSEERHRAIYDQAYIGIARIAKIGRFLLVNQRLCQMLGYTAEELYKQTFYDLILPNEVDESLKDWDSLLSGQLDNFSKEQTYIHKDGRQISANVTVSLVRDSKGSPNYFVAVFEDITERKSQEEQLKESLTEKEVLLKEVHHRVKNNMQVISSILNLQSSYIQDPSALQMLRESQDRIKSMSFIHESLYQSATLSRVNFAEYVTNLSKNLYYSYVRPEGGIELDFDLDEVYLNLDTSIPCGLIINELLSNAMKYAFNGLEQGKITVRLKDKQEKKELVISDDGVGLPPEFSVEDSDTLGLQLVHTLVSQVGGTLEVSIKKGTTFTLLFEEQL